MQYFLLRRVLLMVPTLIGATLLVFAVLRIVPGDIAFAFLAGEEGAAAVDPASLEKLREELGLNRPLPIQYLDWVKNIPQGDLGDSMWNKQPVTQEIIYRFPVTAQIALMAVTMGFMMGIPLGIVSALNRGTWLDNGARFVSISFLAIPNFWLGLMVLLFTVRAFRWMPPLGYNLLWEDPVTNLVQLFFPSLVIGTGQMALIARMTRSTMLEVLREDYVRTARAKGLAERAVIIRHVMRNSMIPVITIVSISFGNLLGGTVVMETVFSVPGIGSYLIEAIIQRDYTVVQALVFFFAVIFVFVNLAVDVSYGWLDPRIRRT
jgi:peptide/nickel transport system permease protein